jgi:hypothetical protein
MRGKARDSQACNLNDLETGRYFGVRCAVIFSWGQQAPHEPVGSCRAFGSKVQSKRRLAWFDGRNRLKLRLTVQPGVQPLPTGKSARNSWMMLIALCAKVWKTYRVSFTPLFVLFPFLFGEVII